MGFRDPITAATAVDTGRGLSDAGVRLYQDTSSPGTPQGVAEWRTGTMSRNAKVTLSGGGSGGSGFTIDGGATQLSDAPLIESNVEQLPAGGYVPVLRLVAHPSEGGQIIQDVATSDLIPKTAFPAGAYPNSTYFGPWGSATYDDAFYQLDANGYVTLGGIVKCKTAGTWPGSATIVQLPAGCRPARQHLVDALTQQSSYGRLILQLDTNGNVNFIGAEPGWNWVAGSPLILDGIRFRAEQ